MSTSIESLPNGDHNKSTSINTNDNTINRSLTGVNQSYINNTSQLPKQSFDNIKDLTGMDNEVHPLPSRDIPMPTLPIVNDVEVTPTYIKKEPTVDYIRNHHNIETIKKNALNTKLERNINGYTQYLTYTLVAILYVLLQLPIVKKMIRSYIPGVFMPEGIPYFSYHILLAIILSAAYFIVDKYVITSYLNNISK